MISTVRSLKTNSPIIYHQTRGTSRLQCLGRCHQLSFIEARYFQYIHVWPDTHHPLLQELQHKKSLDILQLVTKLAYQLGLIYTGEQSPPRFAIWATTRREGECLYECRLGEGRLSVMTPPFSPPVPTVVLSLWPDVTEGHIQTVLVSYVLTVT